MNVAAVANEITRLRAKERESTITHASKQKLPLRGAIHGPTSSVSEYLVDGPPEQAKRRRVADAILGGGRTSHSQLKNDLSFDGAD
ncbi:hypothetical protein [Bradyrhizobium sp. USDA 10063]